MATPLFQSVDIQGIDIDEDLAKAIVDPIFKNNDFEKTSNYLQTLGVSGIFTKSGNHLVIECKPQKRIKLGLGTEVSQQDITIGLTLMANNLRQRLDNLQFKANFGQLTQGLFELQYSIPLKSNLLSQLVHSVRFGNISSPIKMYERTAMSKYVVSHENLPLRYKIGPEVSLRDHLDHSHIAGVGHELIYDSTDSSLPSTGVKWKVSQFISTWNPHVFVKNQALFSITRSLFNFSLQATGRISEIKGSHHLIDKIYSGGPCSVRGFPTGSIVKDQFGEVGLTLFAPWIAFIRPFGFVNYGSTIEQAKQREYGFGSFGGGIAIGFGAIRGEIYYCKKLQPRDENVQERVHIGLGMEFL